jgi:fatty acid desaturase
MESEDRDAKDIPWYRIPVPREDLRQFTQKSDFRGWIQACSFLLIFLATTSIAFYFFWMKMWAAMVIACYLHSLFHQMIGMSAAVHELNHGTVFKTRRINEFFYKLFCFLTWNNPVHFRASHQLHHQYTVYRNLDKEVVQEPAKKTMNWVNYVSWLTFDFKWFWTLVSTNFLHVIGKGNVDFFSWNPLFAGTDPRRKKMIRWARCALFSYVALTAVFAVLHLWVLIYIVIFGNFFATILGRLTSAIQHTGLKEDTPDWRLVCHTVKVNPLIGFLYWNMNYHIEHHMYAAVPWYNLSRFHKAIEKDLPVGPKSFIGGLRLILSIKKKQKVNPDFIYVPEFPETAAPPRLG